MWGWEYGVVGGGELDGDGERGFNAAVCHPPVHINDLDSSTAVNNTDSVRVQECMDMEHIHIVRESPLAGTLATYGDAKGGKSPFNGWCYLAAHSF